MIIKPIAKKISIFALCVILAALGGCFAKNRVTIATLDTPEAILAGEVIAAQLESFGIEVIRGQTYASFAELEAGMRAGEFDISPIFLQDALVGFPSIDERPIFENSLAEEIVNNTLRDVFGYMLLDWWNIQAHYSLFMRGDLVQDDLLGFFALSTQASGLTLAATLDFLESPGGLEHARELFGGLEFEEILVVNQGDFWEASRLNADVLAVRETVTRDRLFEAGYVSIGEEFQLWPINPLIPIANETMIEKLPEIRIILSSISHQITPAEFARNLRAIGHGAQTLEQAAEDLLQSNQR